MAAINPPFPIYTSPSSWHDWKNWQDLSWYDVYNFRATSLGILSGSMEDPLAKVNIKKWHTVAQTINRSLTTTLPFYKGVLNVITLNIFKKWVLQVILPAEINRINIKLQTAPAQGAPGADQNPYLSIFDTLPEHLHAPYVTLIRAQKYFQENKATLLQYYPTYVVPQGSDALSPRDKTSKIIENYFQDKLNLIIENHEKVCIPRWYHATTSEDTVKKILTDATLRQHPAPAGHGVYFSTQHESIWYGSYCFALDASMIHPLPASYFPSCLNSIDSLWIRVEKDVKVIWDSVAHIVVGSDAQEIQLRTALSKVAESLSDDTAATLTVPIIRQEINNILQKCFQAAYGRSVLPQHWKRHHWAYFADFSSPALPYQEHPHRTRKFFFF